MRRFQRWPIVWLLVAAIPALMGSAAAQPIEDAVVESFELDDAEALVTACTVPADNALYQTPRASAWAT